MVEKIFQSQKHLLTGGNLPETRRKMKHTSSCKEIDQMRNLEIISRYRIYIWTWALGNTALWNTLKNTMKHREAT